MPKGSFTDRAAFVAAMREKLAKLMTGLPGRPQEQWNEPAERDTAVLTYFGVRLAIHVAAASWDYDLVIPPVLPVNRDFVARRIETELGSIQA